MQCVCVYIYTVYNLLELQMTNFDPVVDKSTRHLIGFYTLKMLR